MIYLKTEINGVMQDVEIYEDEIYSTCFKCGKAHQLDFELVKDILKGDDGDFSSTSVSCGCNTETTERPILKRIK